MSGRKRLRRPNAALKEKIRKEIINLMENEKVTTFLVGEIGGFEQDAYDTVLEVRENYPDIKVILVISKITELNEIGADGGDYVMKKKYFDDFIYPDECAIGHAKWGIVYRNRYIVEHSDFIIAYNRYRGRAYGFCRAATKKGATVIELSDSN